MPAAAEWPLAPLRPVDGLDYPHGERRIGSNPFAAKNLHSFSNDSESEWTFSGTVDLSPSQSGVLFSHNSVTALEMCDGMMGGANGWIVLGDNANAFAATAKLGVAIAQDFAGEITVESGGKFSIQTTESGGALTFSGNSPISFSVKHDGGEFSITTAAPGATAILANGSA
ncbi:MAG: hypothetical protein LBI39_02285, partial [Puniceicoccales bacterium]|nr:hypothetical protein [Puniceicoccales bacterium]